MHQTAQRTQADLEAALAAQQASLAARPWSPDATVADIFGPVESWMVKIGQRTLLLDPVSQSWYYYDPYHDTWEPTGFGPGEVEFNAIGRHLGYRRLPPPLETCPGCGRSLPPNSRFCPKCGRRFSPVALRCTSCRHDNRPEARFCTRCGRALNQQATRRV